VNPLAAIRQFITPEMRGLPGVSTPASNPIPARELKELSSTLPSFATPPTGDGSFGSMLNGMVNEVNQKQVHAGAAVEGLLKGDNVSLHQAMIAMEEASVSFQLMVEVRNKLLESYQELMRMQI
jgi:flagellar hook-basal body complex protein FliE